MSIQKQFEPTPVGPFGRAALLGLATVLIGCFFLALWLSPDPRGYGTHQQLGLPPCTFRLMFACPCPGCGMTTSFAYFVRGDLPAAFHANPAGSVIAAVFALLIPWSLSSAWFGQLWFVSNPVFACGAVAISLSGLSVVVWVLRIVGTLIRATHFTVLQEYWC